MGSPTLLDTPFLVVSRSSETWLIDLSGETINNTTGTKAVGDGLQYVTGGVDNGAKSIGKGAENAGQWKTS